VCGFAAVGSGAGILPNPHIGRFVKEDGEVIDAD